VTTISVGADVVAYNDPVFDPLVTTYYRVRAANVIGDIDTIGFPVLSAVSAYTNTANVGAAPAAPADPSGLTALLQAGPAVLLGWTDNSVNETGFSVERAVGGGAFIEIAVVGAGAASGTAISYLDSAPPATSAVDYRVRAVSGTLTSGYSNVASVAVPAPPAGALAVPAAPSRVTVGRITDPNGRLRLKVTWKDHANNETGYIIQLAADPAFKTGLITAKVAAGVTSYQSDPLEAGAPYYVRVRSVNGPSSSAWVRPSPGRVIRPEQ
jgi:hypothetical protein